jgi:hypothetical protein
MQGPERSWDVEKNFSLDADGRELGREVYASLTLFCLEKNS